MSSESRAYLDDKQSSVQRPRPLRLQGCLAPGGGGDGAGVVGLVRVLGLFGVLGGNPRPGGPSPGNPGPGGSPMTMPMPPPTMPMPMHDDADAADGEAKDDADDAQHVQQQQQAGSSSSST